MRALRRGYRPNVYVKLIVYVIEFFQNYPVLEMCECKIKVGVNDENVMEMQ